MLDLGTLKIGVQVDGNGAKKELNSLGGEIEKKSSLWGKFGGAAASAGKVAAAGMAALTTAVVGSTAAIVASAKDTAAYGDVIDKTSQKMGFTIQGYQQWDYIMGQCGTSMTAVQTGMKTLNKESAASTEAMKALGISFDESMSNEEKFQKTVEALQGVESETQRAALASELFGAKAGAELMPLLNAGTGSIEAMKGTFDGLNSTMSDEAVKASAAFNDSMDNMTRAMGGAKTQITAQLLPGLTQLMDGFTGIITGVDGAEQKFSEGIDNLVKNLTEAIPKFLEQGVKVIKSLIEGITKALPDLTKAVMEIIPLVVKTIMELLPELIPVAMEMILTFIEGIIEMLPTLTTQIIDLVMLIVNTLIDNLPKLIEMGIEIILALILGIVEALPDIIAKMPEMIAKIITAIIDNLPLLIEAGIQIIMAIIVGMVKMIPELIMEIPKMIMDIIGSLMDAWPEMEEAGRELFSSLWDGIKDIWDGISDWVSDKVSWLTDKLAFWRKGSSEMASSKSGRSIDGSHRNGLDTVPYDGYLAELHKGERVLTAHENKSLEQLLSLKMEAPQQANKTFSISVNVGSVRNDNDIKKISQELQRTITEVDRALGGR